MYRILDNQGKPVTIRGGKVSCSKKGRIYSELHHLKCTIEWIDKRQYYRQSKPIIEGFMVENILNGEIISLQKIMSGN